jgi:1,6-anhydro-N-acetylmuramate kinase
MARPCCTADPVPGKPGATLQLIDAPAMQAALGVPLACDFRTADVAAGGQGAPLAPAYHRRCCSGWETGRPVS